MLRLPHCLDSRLTDGGEDFISCADGEITLMPERTQDNEDRVGLLDKA
jgi:hypothetical protein